MGQNDEVNPAADLDQSTSYYPTSLEKLMDSSVTVDDTNTESEDPDTLCSVTDEVQTALVVNGIPECTAMKSPSVTSPTGRSSNVDTEHHHHHKEANNGYHGNRTNNKLEILYNGHVTDKVSEKNELNKEKEEIQTNEETKEGEEKEDNWFSAVIAICACLIYMCNGGVFYSNGLLLPEFIRMLGCSEVVGTWVASVQMGMCQFVALLGGALIELYGCRAVSLTGSLLITIGLILSAFVSSVPLFFLTYSIIPGIGLGLQFMPCIVVVQYHFTAKRRATATGLVSAGSPLGFMSKINAMLYTQIAPNSNNTVGPTPRVRWFT